MTRAPHLLLLVLLAALALRPGVARADPSDIAAAARSVVRVVLVAQRDGVYQLEGHGSGFAVGPDLIVTNAHVVQSARSDPSVRIGIVPPAGKGGWFARVVGLAPDKDLALLKLSEPGKLPPATLFTGAVTDGEDVFAVGYPGNVDLAQGLDVGDIVSPTSPVKTRGSVSSGRSSKAFETILHTAPLGAGNSGGPLLDSCGRVLGANSFGTEAANGDSEFYFAVSTREIMRFLIAMGTQPRSAGNPCRSIAELDRAEAQRTAGDQARAAEAARLAEQKRALAEEEATRQAMFEVAAARENRLGIAGVALLLALAAGIGAAAVWRRSPGQGRALGGLTLVLLLGAGGAIVTRPGFDDVDSRAHEILGGARSAPPSAAPGGPATSAPIAGRLVCTLEPDRSRVTLSDMADVRLDWRADGCSGGRQYGRDADGWLAITLPPDEDTASTARFDPATGTQRVERYFLDADAMAALRAAAGKLPTPACGAGEAAARGYGDALGGIRALLPAEPNERLVYHCGAAEEGRR